MLDGGRVPCDTDLYLMHAITSTNAVDLDRARKICNYSALPTKSLRIQTAIRVLPGMNGFPSKAP
jgi:hypothetical protein